MTIVTKCKYFSVDKGFKLQQPLCCVVRMDHVPFLHKSHTKKFNVHVSCYIYELRFYYWFVHDSPLFLQYHNVISQPHTIADDP